MARQEIDFPGTGHGNVYIDSLIWGCRWQPGSGAICYHFDDGGDYAWLPS